MNPTRVEDLDDEQRRPFHGITNVVIIDSPELRDRVREMHEDLMKFMTAYARAVSPLLAELGRAFEALRDAGLIDEDGQATRPRDRPAWQSTYGPARHKRGRP